MKRLMAVAMVAVVVGFASTVVAADATGTWKWTSTRGDKSFEASVKLKQEGDKLSGAYVGGQSATEAPIEDAKVAGDKISFKVTRERNGQKSTTAYSGTLKEDTITGTQERERDGQKMSSEWVAKRQK